MTNLEVDLDNVLFCRHSLHSRYPRLTEDGERLLSKAYLIIERCQHLFGAAKSLSERLIVDNLYPSEWLARWLDEFDKLFPSVGLWS